jgi:hypothetical protein
MKAATKNFHLPLAPSVYRALHLEASRQKRPASQVARDAIVWSLAEARRRRIDSELKRYVEENAGSAADRDPILEALSRDVLFGGKEWK